MPMPKMIKRGPAARLQDRVGRVKAGPDKAEDAARGVRDAVAP